MLNPGYARKASSGSWHLDQEALTTPHALLDSMALKIETEFKELYERVKGEAMSDDFMPDLRLLFVGIARGVLGYLRDENDQIVAQLGLPPADHVHDIPLQVVWEEVEAA